ncbi:carbon dioxide-concentrating mechanism protein CcmK [Stenomitos frigidus]|uniref:Carboxysome shell protein CcmK n=1 Tax=Stenomitos frigidus ULC18 TaxID=2107698 RepID=A0A2T1DUQ3_9CYAN|nr:carbon dioxide-concentrating mechanism protein CcmK [Stenomitos frigidus]PSB24161.1 carbon dioxide-concentrating protein CcmK [Stenomitos frigidus ULC18]
MANAVGMVEVLGLPPALSVADTMCKAANVTLVGTEKVSGARYTVIVRGDVSEVNMSVEAGVEAAKRMIGDKPLYLSSHVIARPSENLEYVLKSMKPNAKLAQYLATVDNPPLVS